MGCRQAARGPRGCTGRPSPAHGTQTGEMETRRPDGMSKTLYIPTPADRAAQLPAALLGALADRFRHGGVFVLMLRNDGSVVYHDPAAGPFFQRYVLPLVMAAEPSGA